MERDDAEQMLESTGLSYLADRWLLHRPGAAPIAVEIVEASPARLVVQNVDFGSGYEIGRRFVLGVPEEGCLCRG